MNLAELSNLRFLRVQSATFKEKDKHPLTCQTRMWQTSNTQSSNNGIFLNSSQNTLSIAAIVLI